MKDKGKFSVSKRDKKNARKSLEELKKNCKDQIDGDDVQGGWVQYGGGQSPEDPAKPRL